MYYLVSVNHNCMAAHCTRCNFERFYSVLYIQCSGWWYVVEWKWRGWEC